MTSRSSSTFRKTSFLTGLGVFVSLFLPVLLGVVVIPASSSCSSLSDFGLSGVTDFALTLRSRNLAAWSTGNSFISPLDRLREGVSSARSCGSTGFVSFESSLFVGDGRFVSETPSSTAVDLSGVVDGGVNFVDGVTLLTDLSIVLDGVEGVTILFATKAPPFVGPEDAVNETAAGSCDAVADGVSETFGGVCSVEGLDFACRNVFGLVNLGLEGEIFLAALSVPSMSLSLSSTLESVLEDRFFRIVALLFKCSSSLSLSAKSPSELATLESGFICGLLSVLLSCLISALPSGLLSVLFSILTSASLCFLFSCFSLSLVVSCVEAESSLNRFFTTSGLVLLESLSIWLSRANPFWVMILIVPPPSGPTGTFCGVYCFLRLLVVLVQLLLLLQAAAVELLFVVEAVPGKLDSLETFVST